MAEEKATPKESPADNPMEWLDKRLDAKESPASETSAEPTVAEPAAVPQPVSADWKDVVLPEDIDHGFFRGKKVGDLYQSYRHVETAKQQAERERNEYKQKLEQLEREREADAAARRVAAEGQQRQSQPGEDPRWAEVDNLWFTDNARARKLMSELNAEQAAKIADQKFQQWRQEEEVKERRKQVMDQGGKAYDEARQKLNLDPKVWNLRAPAVMLQLTDVNSPYYGDGYNVFRPEAYLQVYRDIYGEPQQAAPIVVKQAPELPPPPGSKRPTPVSQPDNTISPLGRERLDAVERFAMIGGVDPKRLAERAAKRIGGNRG